MHRDEYYYLNSGGNTGLGLFFGYVLWATFILAGPSDHPECMAARSGAIIYLILGLTFLAVKIASAIRSGKTTLAQEVVFGFKGGEVFAELLIWPIIALIFIFRDSYQISFKRQYYDWYWQNLKSERQGIHVATVNEWTDAETTRLAKKADEQGRIIAETAKPALRVATVGATAVAISTSSAYPQEAKKSETTEVHATISSDRAGDRVTTMDATRKKSGLKLGLYVVNRAAAPTNGDTSTSFFGPGITVPPWKGVSATLIIGPQFNWKNEGKLATVKTYCNLSGKFGKFSIFSNNWFGYGVEQRRITGSRHTQSIGIPDLPWLQPSLEELHVRGVGLTELYTGLKISFGQWLGKNSFFSKASLFPYYNWVKGRKRFDMRLQLVF